MAKRAAKQLSIPVEELISKIDRSGLSVAEQEKFTGWLVRSARMQITIETALRRGYSVKAYSNTYRKQIEYWVRIEDPQDHT